MKAGVNSVVEASVSSVHLRRNLFNYNSDSVFNLAALVYTWNIGKTKSCPYDCYSLESFPAYIPSFDRILLSMIVAKISMFLETSHWFWDVIRAATIHSDVTAPFSGLGKNVRFPVSFLNNVR